MEDHNCWQCGHTAGGSLFCRYCNTLQPPETDYYGFFGLDLKLSLDVKDLQERFYRLSRTIHPDHYTRASGQERLYSLEATSILNDSYRTLRDPVARAEYVLRQKGFPIGEQRTKDVPADLLEEVFELNMALEELRDGDEATRPRLQESLDRFVAMRSALDAELDELFHEHDEAESGERKREVLGRIRGLLNRRRYIQNLVRDVERELAPPV